MNRGRAAGEGAKRRPHLMRAALTALILLVLSAHHPAVASTVGETRLVALSARPSGEGAVLTVRLSAAAPMTFFTLDRPRRLVIDYASTSGAGTAGPLPPMFGQPRHGLFRADRARIVVPLARPMAVVRAEPLPEGGLELTLTPVSDAAFADASGWPPGARWEGEEVPRPPGKPGDRRLVVAIDPGHGGIDPGAHAGGLVEKEIVLAFARRLARALEETGRIRPVLTRERDVFLPLGARVRLAQRAGAHLMISLHADIVTEGDATGLSIYTLAQEASDAAAALMAERENRADILAGAEADGVGDDVARVLIELAQKGAMAEADRLAAATLAALAPRVPLLRSRPHREAELRVLKAPDIPSILIELGFLSNAEDRARIVSPEWQEQAAAGIARGILDWARQTGEAWRRPRN